MENFGFTISILYYRPVTGYLVKFIIQGVSIKYSRNGQECQTRFRLSYRIKNFLTLYWT